MTERRRQCASCTKSTCQQNAAEIARLSAELKTAEATIWAVQEACKAKQGPRYNNDPYNRGWDNALAYVESKVALGERDE